MTAPPIPAQTKRKLQQEVDRCVKIAKDRFGIDLKPRVVFDHAGIDSQRVAGTAFYADSTLYYNPWYLTHETEEFMARTVPHEVAHLVVRKMQEANKAGWKIDVHGPVFRKVMTAFGVQPKHRTEKHEFNVLVLPQYQKCSLYKCEKCQHTHVMRQHQHQRMSENPKRYGCVKCNGNLKLFAEGK